MEIRKMSFIQRLKAAVSNFNFANVIVKERTRTAVKYFSILVLCISLVTGIMGYIALKPTLEDFEQVLKNDVPNFDVTNGVLTVEGTQPYYSETDTNLMVVDSTGSLTIQDLKSKTTTKDIMLFSKDTVYYYSPKNSSLNREFSYDLLRFNFSKQSILNMLQNHNIALYLSAYVAIILFIGKFIGTLVVWILAMFTASIKRVRLTSGQKYSLALYALTIPSIFNVIFNLSRFRLFYYLIAVIYLSKYIDAIKKDNRSRQQTPGPFNVTNTEL